MTTHMNMMIDALSCKHRAKTQRLVSLLQNYGISYFCLQTVSNEGKWSLIDNRPDWQEHSADSQFYLHDPSVGHPKFYRNGIVYTATHDEQIWQNRVLKDAKNLFNLTHGLVIIDKTHTGVEFSFFASDADNHQVINTYINHTQVLKKFIQYFKQEMVKPICEMQDIYVDLLTVKKDFFDIDENLFHTPPEPEMPLALDTPSTDITITKRENECLRYTLRGMTAKEIARMLQISHRTVEIHLHNIRKKYGLSSKRQFISIPS